MSTLTALVIDVDRNYDEDDPDHVELTVRQEFDLHPDQWSTLTKDEYAELIGAAQWAAGQLARIGMAILHQLALQAAEHKCYHKHRRYRDGTDAEIPPYRDISHPECHMNLSIEPYDHAARDDELPRLYVYVPRNRERSWRARLSEVVSQLSAGVAMAAADIQGERVSRFPVRCSLCGDGVPVTVWHSDTQADAEQSAEKHRKWHAANA